jgi:hypothetical protein
MKTLHSEITIAAPPEHVWDVLVDVERYADWNPFLVDATGMPAEGTRLRVTLSPPGGRRMKMRPRVTAFERPLTFEWLGHVLLPGIFDGRHRFELHPVDGGRATRLVQREEFRGMLVPLLARQLDKGTLAGFAAMNQAIKARVEQSRPPSEAGQRTAAGAPA